MTGVEPNGRKRFDLDCSAGIRGYQREWFSALRDRVQSGQPFLIVEALTPHEIFEAFEIPFVTNEWWSGIVASNRQSGYYFEIMEAAGYSRRLEYYPALSLAGAIDKGAHPEPAWGGLPQPSMIVRRQNIWHNSRRKLAECGRRPGDDIKRRACGAASADVRWSSV